MCLIPLPHHSEMMRSCKCSPPVGTMPTLMINTINSTLSNPQGVHFFENDIYSVSAEKIISDAFSYSENV